MDDTPTTINGPLHGTNTAAPAGDDRAIIAFYASEPDAVSARDSLISAGVAADQIVLQAHPASDPTIAAQLHPAEQSVLGKIRQVIAPEETSRLPQEAVQEGQSMLTVTPGEEDAERIVSLLEATHPRHFDARLERWRNTA